MSVTPNIPQKPFFRINEVCQLTDTQPYVLRFWESEFPQLSPDHGHGGKPVYKKGDVELILQIKHLLYEEEYTLAGARQVLSGASPARRKPAKVKVSAKKRAQPEERDSRPLNLDAPVPEEVPEKASYVLGSKIGLPLRQRLEMLRMPKESDRQKFLAIHLDRIVRLIRQQRSGGTKLGGGNGTMRHKGD